MKVYLGGRRVREHILYIIGNGFDIYHGLNTSVMDFIKILSKTEIYNTKANALEVFEEYCVDWNEYEDSLSKMDLGRLDENNVSQPDYSSEYEYDRDSVVWKMESYLDSLSKSLMDSLAKMINDANNDLNGMCRKMRKFLFEGDAVLSFNYTSTIEKLYDFSENIRILHIHGYYEENEELIFGYKEGDKHVYYKEHYFNSSELKELENKIEELNNNKEVSETERVSRLQYYYDSIAYLTDYKLFYVDMQREAIIRFYLRWAKEIQLEKLKKFLTECDNISTICVMGHSMANVDRDYMELIEGRLHPQKWYISQYQGKPTRDMLSNYSFKDKVVFYELDDFIN